MGANASMAQQLYGPASQPPSVSDLTTANIEFLKMEQERLKGERVGTCPCISVCLFLWTCVWSMPAPPGAFDHAVWTSWQHDLWLLLAHGQMCFVAFHVTGQEVAAHGGGGRQAEDSVQGPGL
jgi:hypothetical protein